MVALTEKARETDYSNLLLDKIFHEISEILPAVQEFSGAEPEDRRLAHMTLVGALQVILDFSKNKHIEKIFTARALRHVLPELLESVCALTEDTSGNLMASIQMRKALRQENLREHYIDHLIHSYKHEKEHNPALPMNPLYTIVQDVIDYTEQVRARHIPRR